MAVAHPRTAALSVFRRLPVPLRRVAVRLITPRFTVGAVVVLRRGEEVLLVRQRHTGRWALPGGLLKRGEDERRGAAREAHEELGVEVDVAPGPPRAVVDSVARRVDLVFEGSYDGTPRPDGQETLDVGWFPLDGLPDVTGPTRAIARTLR